MTFSCLRPSLTSRAPIARRIVEPPRSDLLIVPLLYVVEQAVLTFERWIFVERERDQWQRPTDISRSLDYARVTS